MKNEPRLIDYLGTDSIFESRWGSVVVSLSLYKGTDFDLCCLFETWRRLRFLPMQSEYAIQFDNMKWVGVSPYFDKLPLGTKAIEYEIRWEKAIDMDGIISIECYYRKVDWSALTEWIILPNGVDNENT